MDAEALFRQERVFRDAIRQARPCAREGEMFTPEVSGYFRAQIDAAIQETGFDVAAALEDEEMDQDRARSFVMVNEPFPWSAGSAMWPAILWRLPELPDKLEYRFVGRDLVLIDILANLVVDVLRDALPEGGPVLQASWR